MKNQPGSTWTKRFLIDPVLRRYKRELEARIDRNVKAGTFDRELSAKVDATLFLLGE